jgi:ABC-type uncharacterized transport system ATPase subunit
MTETPITADDMKRAREILAAHGMPDDAARVVAQALAEGRAQGLEMGLKMLSGKARH